MASRQTLRQHNQKQARPQDTRNAKHPVHGTAPVGSKPHSASSAPDATKIGAENQDPSTRNFKGTAGRHLANSRLPVLARSQSLQPQADFTQVHRKWDHSFQKGTAQKKPCTKPVPFSLSQPKASRAATASQRKTQPTDAGAPKLTCRNASQPPRPITSSSTAPPIKLTGATLPLSAPHATGLLGSDCEQLNSQLAASIVTAQTDTAPLTDEPSRDACLRPAGPTNGVQFSPDPAALDSILKGEGVKSSGLLAATPKSSVCPTGRGASVYMPQRVSVLRTQTRPPGASAVGAVRFSPDLAALHSILRNEGVNAEGQLVVTQKTSLCPPGRETSMYMPLRVPIAKGQSEAAGVGAGAALSLTPAVKWTPLRVPNTRPQSAMQNLSAHRASLLRGSPSLRSLLRFEKELGPHKKEPLVQKLFEDAEQEEEPVADIEEEIVTDGQKGQLASQQLEERVEGARGGLLKEDWGRPPPFIPPPNRESVIVFSSAKKITAATSAQPSRPGPPDLDSVPSPLPLPASSCAPAPPRALPPPLPSLGGARGSFSGASSGLCSSQTGYALHPSLICAGGIVHWFPPLRPGAPTARQRPPLEESLLDEECAAFTSRPSTAPAHPRCTNPVASVLLLQTSTCFVPIDLPPLSTTREFWPICCPVLMSAKDMTCDLRPAVMEAEDGLNCRSLS